MARYRLPKLNNKRGQPINKKKAINYKPIIIKKTKFDFELYRENYNDLKDYNNTMLIYHYQKIGRLEGRTDSNLIYTFYPDFNKEVYKNNYEELLDFNDLQLERHWMVYGRHHNYSYKTLNQNINRNSFIEDRKEEEITMEKEEKPFHISTFNFFKKPDVKIDFTFEEFKEIEKINIDKFNDGKVIFCGANFSKISNHIENSFIITISELIEKKFINCLIYTNQNLDQKLLKKLSNRNILILDTKDKTNLDNLENLDYFSCIIVNNSYCRDYITQKYNYNDRIEIIYDFSEDTQINTNEKLKIGIIDNKSFKSKNIYEIIGNIFNIELIDKNQKFIQSNFIIADEDQNLNFTSNNLLTFIPKNSLVFINKSRTNIELLGKDYPFYIDDFNLDKIIDIIFYALKIFKTDLWNDLQDNLNIILDEIGFNKIIEQYKDIFYDLIHSKKQIDLNKKNLLLIFIINENTNISKIEKVIETINEEYFTKTILVDNYTFNNRKIELEKLSENFDNIEVLRTTFKNIANCYNLAISKIKKESFILFLNSEIENFNLEIFDNLIKNINKEIKFTGYCGGLIKENNIEPLNEELIIQNEPSLFIDCFCSLLDSQVLKEINWQGFNINYQESIYAEIDFFRQINKKFPCKLLQNNNFKPNYKNSEIDSLIYNSRQNITSRFVKNIKYTNTENLKNAELFLNPKQIYSIPELLNNKLKEIKNMNKKNKPVLLTIAQSLYPPNGGGENWLIDIMRFLENDYFCVGICFRDVFKNMNFTSINGLVYHYIPILQMPYDFRTVTEIIKILNPEVISHQGFLRTELCKICSCYNIKLITGFCFWNDLLIMDESFSNITMHRNKYQENPNLQFILENANCYFASYFMKDIVSNKLQKEIDIDVIPSISHKSHYYQESNERKYVCILNSHNLKGGQELIYLLNNLDIEIPILGIITEQCGNENLVKETFRVRNSKNDINKLFTEKVDNISQILKQCKILLVPSIVDETFCRVAYEGMALGLPIISYRTGNLTYLLNDYPNNIFIDLPRTVNRFNTNIDNSTLRKWKQNIEKIYENCCNQKYFDIDEFQLEIRQKLIDLINKPKKQQQKNKIGILCPFADQGLGIQCREYIYFLNNHGYETAVFSHKPYFTKQVDESEWEFENVYYSKNTREDITFDEVLEWVIKNKVKILLFPEVCYNFIFTKIDYFKCLGVKIIAIINIETLRYNDLPYYHLIDYFWTNNYSAYQILQQILPKEKVKLLEFNNSYLPKLSIEKLEYKPNRTIKFATFGGLNSLIRKNIDKTYNIFKRLEQENYDFILNIYIQDPDSSLKQIKSFIPTNNINIIIRENNYKQTIENIKKSDIIVHLGDHEGLGLGFYEALNNSKALITLNTYPNKELVKHEVNGWIVECNFSSLVDNDCGITNKADVNIEDYYQLVRNILTREYRPKLENILLSEKIIQNNYERNFIELIDTIN